MHTLNISACRSVADSHEPSGNTACEDIRSPDDVEGLAERIGTSLSSPFSIMGVTVSITESVSVIVCESHPVVR